MAHTAVELAHSLAQFVSAGAGIVLGQSPNDGWIWRIELATARVRHVAGAFPTTDSPATLCGTLAFGKGGAFVLKSGRLTFTPGVTEKDPMTTFPEAKWARSVPDDSLLYMWAGDCVVVSETSTDSGVVSHPSIVPTEGPARPLPRVEGVLRALAGSEALLVYLVERDETSFVEVVDRRTGVRFAHVHLPSSSGRCEPSVFGSLAAVPHGDGVLLVRGGGDTFTAARVALGGPAWVRAIAGGVLAHRGRILLSLDLESLTWSSDACAQDLRVALVRPQGDSPEGHAKVIFAGARMAALTHPTLGRVNLKLTATDPPLAAGDHVVLDDVHETVPAVFEVRRWHVAGQAEGASAPDDVLVFEAKDAFSPPSSKAPDVGVLDRIRADLRRTGQAVPAPLMQLAERFDSEPQVRRLLREISVLLDEAPDGDEELVPLAGRGSGDALYLLVHPTAIANAGAGGPPVIEWIDDEEEFEWVGADVEEWLNMVLSSHKRVRRSLAAGLGWDPKKKALESRDPPDWFDEIELYAPPFCEL
ncbi:MAG: hypothetical protein AB8I08_15440 [Sandaracinaceae bacterium]